MLKYNMGDIVEAKLLSRPTIICKIVGLNVKSIYPYLCLIPNGRGFGSTSRTNRYSYLYHSEQKPVGDYFGMDHSSMRLQFRYFAFKEDEILKKF